MLNQTGLLINSHDPLRVHVLKHIRRTTPVWSALLGGVQGRAIQNRTPKTSEAGNARLAQIQRRACNAHKTAFDFLSPVRRLDISPTSGGLGEHCPSSAVGHVLCALLGRVAQPRLLVKYRGNPAGAAHRGRLLWVTFLGKTRKVTCCRATPGGFSLSHTAQCPLVIAPTCYLTGVVTLTREGGDRYPISRWVKYFEPSGFRLTIRTLIAPNPALPNTDASNSISFRSDPEIERPCGSSWRNPIGANADISNPLFESTFPRLRANAAPSGSPDTQLMVICIGKF
ncbi:hypothetical protein [Sideroxydans sp. CL21]|nr:hypothetical protein [Sideroxydans sp. CL21]